MWTNEVGRIAFRVSTLLLHGSLPSLPTSDLFSEDRKEEETNDIFHLAEPGAKGAT